ncbi:hypothetical protein M8C21_014871, partial [Ambrosia artemisiifolia]
MTKILIMTCFLLLVLVSVSGFSGIPKYPSKPKGAPVPPSGPAPPGYSCRGPERCPSVCRCSISEINCTNGRCHCGS